MLAHKRKPCATPPEIFSGRGNPFETSWLRKHGDLEGASSGAGKGWESWCWSYTPDLKRGRSSCDKNTDAPIRSGRQFSRPHLSKLTYSAKPAACFGTYLGRQLNPVAPRLCPELPNLSVESASPLSPVLNLLVRGSGGAFDPPEPVPHQIGSSFTHGMTSDCSLPQPVCQPASVRYRGPRSTVSASGSITSARPFTIGRARLAASRRDAYKRSWGAGSRRRCNNLSTRQFTAP